MKMTHPKLRKPAQRLFAVASIFLAGIWNSSAANVSLKASDASGATSFNTAGNWNNSLAPAAGNSYFTTNFNLRTPAPTTSGNNYIFAGDSLEIDTGARFIGKIGNNVVGNTTSATITVNNLILNGGTMEQSDVDNDNASLTVAGNVTVNTATVMGGIGGTGNNSTYFDTLEFTAPISGSAGLQISGSQVNTGQETGVVKLSAANPYTGTLTVTNGYSGSTGVIASAVNRILQLNNVNALQNATLNLISTVTNPVSFTSGANTGAFNVGALTGTSTMLLADTAGSPVTLSVGGNNATTTYSGPMSGAGALTKVGNGVLTLAGTNTFSGDTTVGAGTLALAATASITNSQIISVAFGATLDVSANAFTLLGSQTLMSAGTNRGSINAASGASIYPGTDGTYGTNVVTGSLTFASGAATYMDLGATFNGANDLIAVGVNLTLNDTVFYLKAPSTSINLDTSADYTLITVAGTISGSAASTPTWSVAPQNAANYSIIQSNNSIRLHYTPSAPPAGTLSFSPNTVSHNQSALASVTVTSSSHPISTVTLDASPIGGSRTLQLFPAGGNLYTNLVAANPGVALGAYPLVATITDNTSLSGTTPAATLTVVTASAVWNGGGANYNWGANANWTSGAAPGYAGDSVTFAGTVRPTPNMETSYSVSALTFDGTAGSFVIGGTGVTLTLTAGGIVNNSTSNETLNVPVVDVGPQTFSAASGNLTFGQAVTNGDQLLTVNGGANATFNGGVAGAGGFDMESSGTLTFTGTNTFTGSINVGNGTVEIAGAGLLGGGNYSGNITNFGALIYSSSVDQTNSGIISELGLTQNGPDTLTLSGNNTYVGDTVINGGVLCIGGSGTLGGGAYSGNLDDNGTFQYSSSASQTLSGSASGSGGVIVDGPGTLTLNVNGYTGPTVVRGGVLALNPGTVGYGSFGNLTVSNGALTVNTGNGGSIGVSSLTLSSNAVVNLNYTFSTSVPGAAAISAPSFSAPGANVTINIGGVAPPIGQFPLISYTGAALSSIANITLGARPPGATASLVNNTANHSIDLNVTALNPAIWIGLDASDTFGNSSFVTNGNWASDAAPTVGDAYYTGSFVLRTPSPDPNPYTFAGSALSIDTGGRFLFKGTNGQIITVPNLILNGGVVDFAYLDSDNLQSTLAGNITLQPGLTGYLGALGGAGGFETFTITAPISGSGNLQIGGSVVNTGQDVGNVVFSATNTYTGATTVASGTVVVNGSMAGTVVTVTSNGTLAGLGTLAGPVTVQLGGILAPGIPASGALAPTIGTLTVNNSVTLSGAATMRISPGSSPNSDELAASTVAVSPGAVLTVTNIGSTTLAAGNTFALFSVPITGAFATVTLPPLPSTNVVWTNKLAVNGTIKVLSTQTVNTAPTNIVASTASGSLTLSWPLDHTGWTLQVQTNAPGAGLGANWVNVVGSTSTNSVIIPISAANGSVFYRLIY